MFSDEEMLAKYRRLYPFLTEEQILELRERNIRFLKLALRQIDRLKREGKWPPPCPECGERHY